MGRPLGSPNKKTLERAIRAQKPEVKTVSDNLLAVEKYIVQVSKSADLIDQRIKDVVISEYKEKNPLPDPVTAFDSEKYMLELIEKPESISSDLRNAIIDQYLTALNSGSVSIPDFLRDFIISKYKFENSVGTKDEILAALPKDEILFKIPEPILQSILQKLPAIKEKYPFNNYQEFIEKLISTSLNLFLQTV